MPLPATQLESLIRKAFPEAKITLADLAGDDDHWELTVTDASFQGLSRVEQHKKVYAALGTLMGRELHALKLITKASE